MPATKPGVAQRYGETTDSAAQIQALAQFGITARPVEDADFGLIEDPIARGIPVPCGYLHRGPIERPSVGGDRLIVIGHTKSLVIVNDPWGEPALISGATVGPDGMGLWLTRANHRCAGLRLRAALDGGADRGQRLPLRAREGVGHGLDGSR